MRSPQCRHTVTGQPGWPVSRAPSWSPAPTRWPARTVGKTGSYVVRKPPAWSTLTTPVRGGGGHGDGGAGGRSSDRGRRRAGEEDDRHGTQKTDGQKTDGQKTDGQKTDGHETEGQKTDGHETEGQETDEPRAHASKRCGGRQRSATVGLLAVDSEGGC